MRSEEGERAREKGRERETEQAVSQAGLVL